MVDHTELIGRWGFDSELGIATHYVPQPALAGLVEAIQNLDNPTLPRLASLITQHSEPAPAHPSTLPSEASSYSSKSNPDALSPICGSVRKLLDQAFSQSTVAKIYKVLNEAIEEDKGVWDDRAKQWARDQIKTMDTRSPTGMKIALGNYKQAKKYKDLRVQLNNDLAMCAAFLVGSRLPGFVWDLFISRLKLILGTFDHLRARQQTTWSTRSSTS